MIARSVPLIFATALGLSVMTAPAPAEESGAFRIVTLGTSLTARGGWQEPLRHALAACRSDAVSVVNLAKSGMTSQWGLTQIDKALAARPDIVLVEFAINDAALTQFLSISRSSANMTEIVSRLRAGETKPRVYVMAMNPVSGLRGMSRPFLADYTAAHEAVARRLGVGFIDHRPAWARLSDDEVDRAVPDGTHPDPETATRVMVPTLVHALAGSDCPAAKTE